MPSLDDFFRDTQELVIHQLKEWVEILSNFETVNKYEILNIQDARIGLAAEVSGGFKTTLLRMWLKSHRPLDVQIFDAQGGELLKIKRPFYFFFSDMSISDSRGNLVGAIRKRFGIIYKKYDLSDAQERVFARIKAPFWRLWTFPILDDTDKQIGVISKKWGGVIKEAFTDADRFQIQFPPSADTGEKAVILAGALSVDLDYFEENAGRSSN